MSNQFAQSTRETAMTTTYYTNSPELANNILSMPTVEMMLAWYRECLNVAQKTKRESLADAARELAHLWCEQNSGVKIIVVAK